MQEIGGILSDGILKGLSMIIVGGDFDYKVGEVVRFLPFEVVTSSPRHQKSGGIERYRAVAKP